VRQERTRPLVEAFQPRGAREAVADQPEDQARRGDPLRPVSLGRPVLCSSMINRKNALFAGSDGGAEQWAMIASLIETCRFLGVKPHGSLADVSTRIVNHHPQSRLDELLPWDYPATPKLRVVA
jgi:hypothetical protein